MGREYRMKNEVSPFTVPSYAERMARRFRRPTINIII
jgi:hypothetical protein